MKRVLFAVVAAILAGVVFLHPRRAPVALPDDPAPDAPHHKRVVPRHAHPLTIVVYVSGAVLRPGLYTLPAAVRTDDAVRAAGGLRSDADPDAINLAERLSDGDHVSVARAGAAPVSRRSHTTVKRRRGSPRDSNPAPVEVNDATPEQLAHIPGIGKALAGRIVALREQEGPFADADSLLDVSGMTVQRLDRARDYMLFDR